MGNTTSSKTKEEKEKEEIRQQKERYVTWMTNLENKAKDNFHRYFEEICEELSLSHFKERKFEKFNIDYHSCYFNPCMMLIPEDVKSYKQMWREKGFLLEVFEFHEKHWAPEYCRTWTDWIIIRMTKLTPEQVDETLPQYVAL